MATNPKTPKKDESPKALYVVISALEHDGERYEEGAEIELTETQAKPLLGHTVTAKASAKAD